MTTNAVLNRAPDRTTGDPRRWLMLAVLMAGQFMALLDATIVNVAIPSLRADLHTSGSMLQLVVAGYTVSYAMLLITGARLGDLYGRRRVFLAGVLTFTVSSLLCGIAPTALVLIAARVVQGAGAALMMPQIMSTVQTRFSGQERTRALSAYSAVIAVGAVCGMVLGGALVSANLLGAGWRPVFLVNVPIGIVVAILLPRLMPADRPTGGRRLDLVGLALSASSVCLVVVPLVLGHELGWPAWTFACLVAGLVLAVVFVLVERRITDPLMNFAVLRVPGVSAGLATLACGMVAYGGFLFALSLHLQSGLGDSPLRAGLTWAPGAALFGFCGYHWRRLPARVHHTLVTAGFTVGAIGYLATAVLFAHQEHSSVAIAATLLLFGAGIGTAFGPLMTHTLVNVPPTSAADASGLVTTTFQLGQVVGVAVFGSLFLTLAGQQASSGAIATTLSWIALLTAVGAALSIALARTILRANR